eukprot:gb/GECG01001276.1/.p1 GENE.gb/GECG01001276.1/~~gb/GECG01001276.1/.p1  ORF type:complete len:117 (+),score=5.26 gb/GECG01001276.1/:1-351(+)
MIVRKEVSHRFLSQNVIGTGTAFVDLPWDWNAEKPVHIYHFTARTFMTSNRQVPPRDVDWVDLSTRQFFTKRSARTFEVNTGYALLCVVAFGIAACGVLGRWDYFAGSDKIPGRIR